LREKAVPSNRWDPGQNEKENATWLVLVPEEKMVVEFFSTALSYGGTRFREVERWGRTALNGTAALSPGTNRNLDRHYDINSAQKRHFLRRQLGPQQFRNFWWRFESDR